MQLLTASMQLLKTKQAICSPFALRSKVIPYNPTNQAI